MRKLLLLSLVGFVVLLIGACAPAAQPAVKEMVKEKEAVKEVPKETTRLKMVVINRLAYAQYPFYEAFAKGVEDRTNGKVKIELLSLPELGLTGNELLRVVKAGIVDGIENYVGYVAGDVPILDMLNLPGLFPNHEANLKAIEAFKPFLIKFTEDNFNAVTVSINIYPENMIYTKKPVVDLKDFKGLRTRIHSAPLAQMMSALGGEPANIAYAEVYTALERGVLDAAITTTVHGRAAKWQEVTTYFSGTITGLPYATNIFTKKTWAKLPPDVQAIILDEAQKMEKKFFDWAIYHSGEAGITENTKIGLKWNEFSPEVKEIIRETVRTKLVPAWAERAGPEGKRVFNEAIAPIVGYAIAP